MSHGTPTEVRRQTQSGQSKDGTRIPPHNLDAEEALLGVALTDPDAMEVCVTEVDADDFYDPAHGHIHTALVKLWESGLLTPDRVLVADELAARGVLEEVGGAGRLTSISGMAPHTAHVREYARIVTELATLRRMITTAAEIAFMAYDLPPDVTEAYDMARHMISAVELRMGGGDPARNADELLTEDDEYDWLVPGLLERRDRIIVTGGEGHGKSTLLRQLAVMFAAGMHPFRFHAVPPVRVLVVDVENSVSQTRRAIEPMVRVAARSPRWNADNLRYEFRTEGLDLTARKDSRWLLERVATNAPDVLIIGPLYKLHADDPNDEQPARRVASVLDMARELYDTAVVLEAHAPHAGQSSRPLRPYGSSLWLRWPEFGYGIRPDTDAGRNEAGRPLQVRFEPWRGSRDERAWPSLLSSDGREFWPWRDASQPPAPDTPV